MKTYVINLPDSTERRQFMENQLVKTGLDYEITEAVNGHKLTQEQIEGMCDMDRLRAWSMLMTPGVIGCSLSHYNVYRKMVENSIPQALVLEDDTELHSQFTKVVQSIERGLETKAIDRETPILLYFQSKEQVQFAAQSKVDLGDCKVYYPIDVWKPITTVAYVVTLECARRLADFIYPIKYTADSWGVFHRENVIAGIRCVLPLPVQSGFFKSDIGYEMHKPFHRFVKTLERNNVFPVKQLLQYRRRRLAVGLNAFEIVDKQLIWQPKNHLVTKHPL